MINTRPTGRRLSPLLAPRSVWRAATPPPPPPLSPLTTSSTGSNTTLWKVTVPAATTLDLTAAAQSLASGLSPGARRWGLRPARGSSAPFSLELHSQRKQTTLAMRGKESTLERVFGHLLATYGQGEVEIADPSDDPLNLAPDEAASYALLHLEGPAALPFGLPEPRAFAAGQDALPGVLNALAGVPAPLRAVSQVIVRPAPTRWGARYARQLTAPRSGWQGRTGPGRGAETSELVLAILAACALLGWLLVSSGYLWLLLLLGLVAFPAGVGGLLWWSQALRVRQRLELAAQDCREKLGQTVCQTCVRLVVLGPAQATVERERALDQLIGVASSAWSGLNRLQVGVRGTRDLQGSLAARAPGWQEIEQAFQPHTRWERVLFWLAADRVRPILTLLELAALWHYPQQAALLPGLAVQLSRSLPAPPQLLLPAEVIRSGDPMARADPSAWTPHERAALQGLFGGVSRRAGKHLPVRLPDEMLEGHSAIIGSTGAGKSAFLAHFLRWAFADPSQAVFVLDVHNDLVRRLAGLVSDAELTSERKRLVVIDPVDAAPVGFPSLWDPALAGHHHRQEEVVSNIVTAVERLSDGAWGARVRTHLMTALSTLMYASATDVAEMRPEPLTHTVLDVYDLFTRPAFRDDVLARLDWSHPRHLYKLGDWTHVHGALSAPQALSEVQSVLNRIKPLIESPASNVLGQRHPRWSLRQALEKRQMVLVALGGLGLETRRTLGSLLLSYLQGILLEQQREHWEKPEARPRVLVVVDELQAYDPNALLGLFGEIRKFGGRMLVATSSLTQVQQASPLLMPEMLNNAMTWLVGRINDQHDAVPLLERLQGTARGLLTLSDLQHLHTHHFYVRTPVEGQPVPAFSLIAPPYAKLESTRIEPALQSSRDHYGRPEAEVEAEVFQVAAQYEVPRLQEATRQNRRKQARGQAQDNQAAAAGLKPRPEAPWRGIEHVARAIEDLAIEEEPAPESATPTSAAGQGQPTKGARRGTRGGSGHHTRAGPGAAGLPEEKAV